MNKAAFPNIKNVCTYSLQVLLLAACYFLAGQASFALAVSHNIVTLVVFSAEGFALAAVILLGSRVVVGIFLGQLLLALNNDLAVELAFGIAIINSLEAILGATLFRYFQLRAKLDRMIDVSGLLLLIFFVLQPLSASFGILLLWVGEVIQTSELQVSWFSWWFGNAMGQVLITPMLLSFFCTAESLKQRLYKALFTVGVITPISLLIFSQAELSSVAMVFTIAIPLLILIAAKLGMSAATLATFIFATAALFYTHNKHGVFVSDEVVLIQDLNLFLLGMALCSQFIAALLSERKKMEHALRSNAEKFQAMINGSPVPMAINDEALNITMLNTAFIKTFGYTLIDIPTLNDWWSKAYPETDYRQWVMKTWQENFNLSKQNQSDFEAMEINICCKNGDYKTVIVNTASIEENFKNEYLVVLFDITEHKHNEERIKLCQSYGGIGIWESDMRTHKQIWSEEVFSLLGFPKKNEPTWNDFLGAIYPEDRQNVIDKSNAHILHGENYDVEYRIINENKKIRWMRSMGGAERNSHKEAIYFRGIVQDITERKQAEIELANNYRYFEALVSISPIGVFQTDARGNCRYVNSRWSELTGLNVEQALGHGWRKGLHPDDNKKVFNEWQASTLENRHFLLEYRFLRPDGSVFWVLGQTVAIKDATGKITGYMGTVTDISEHKQREKELQRSNADLEQFAYAVSHDMRQPLRMVSSYLTLLKKALAAQLDPETRELFNFAIDGAKRMDAMILALLDFSRVGRKSDAMMMIDTQTVLNEALVFLAPEIKTNQGVVNVNGQWIKLIANRDEISRLLQNLIANALKYHQKDEPPQVDIRGEVKDTVFQVSISDKGIGINPEQIERLFKIFSRLHAQSHFEGTGIGLALCRKIIEHHGGKIWIESKGEGYGTTFKFNLPLKK